MPARTFKYMFSVFTPSYNRAHLLPRLYRSLKEQTYKDFEWIIVDDGSTDNTKEVVRGWIQENAMPIRYLQQPNGGKHTAINHGVREAHGYFFAIMDSDDWYKMNALERLLHHWENIPDTAKERYTGTCGLFAYESGEIVGTRFPKEIFDTDDIDLRIRYRVKGDKLGATRTEIMRKFPFPEDMGTFVTESLVWHRIGSRYLTRFVNEIIGWKEYQPGGLMDTSRVIMARNSKASRQYYYEIISMERGLPIDIAIRSYSNYIRHSLHQNIGWKEQAGIIPSKVLWGLCYPLGVILARKDRKLLKEGGAS